MLTALFIAAQIVNTSPAICHIEFDQKASTPCVATLSYDPEDNSTILVTDANGQMFSVAGHSESNTEFHIDLLNINGDTYRTDPSKSFCLVNGAKGTVVCAVTAGNTKLYYAVEF